MDEHTISPAGDPFTSQDHHEAKPDSEAGPHICNSGWITLGQEVVGEDGEERTEYALYLCRLCAEEAR